MMASQNKEPLMRQAMHFWNVPHIWSKPQGKHYHGP
jgi:hypothetical protein